VGGSNKKTGGDVSRRVESTIARKTGAKKGLWFTCSPDSTALLETLPIETATEPAPTAPSEPVDLPRGL